MASDSNSLDFVEIAEFFTIDNASSFCFVAGAFTSDISNEGYHRVRLTKSGVIALFSYKLDYISSPNSDLLCFKNIDFAFVSIPKLITN